MLTSVRNYEDHELMQWIERVFLFTNTLKSHLVTNIEQSLQLQCEDFYQSIVKKQFSFLREVPRF